MSLNLRDFIFKSKNKEINFKEIANAYISIAKNSKYNSWIKVINPEDIPELKYLDLPLAGAAVGVKDLIMTKGMSTTCGSKILQNYIPCYNATCVENLVKNGGIIIGKNNLDEFAMGGSGENSAYGIVKNPNAEGRISGGSSSGSAASVAAGECIASIGTDTGGSVRQPAAMCGVVGFKPTYGFVSRYGVQSMANSLDQVGVIAQNVDDAWLLLQNIGGYDEKDSTSLDYKTNLNQNNKIKKIAIVKQFFSKGLDPEISKKTLLYISELKKLGYIIQEVDFELLEFVVAVYYTIMPAESSTNLARYDGVKFGKELNTDQFDNYINYYTSFRSDNFGEEVKNRIMIGSYVLSAGFADQYYKKAVKIRNLICNRFDEIFAEYDLIIGPTCPTVARKIGSVEDPLSDYLADIYTIPANLAGIPAISIPIGTISEDGLKLPIGIQIMANKRDELKIIELGKEIENIKL